MKIRMVGLHYDDRSHTDVYFIANSEISAVSQDLIEEDGRPLGEGFAYLSLPDSEVYLVSEHHPEFSRGL